MNNPLGVSPSKGNQVTTRGKEKIFDLGGNKNYTRAAKRPEVIIQIILTDEVRNI